MKLPNNTEKVATIAGAGSGSLTVAYELKKRTNIRPIVFEKTDGAPTDLDDYKAKIKTLYSLERFMKDDPELASEVKRRYRQLAKWKINHDQAESYQSEIYNSLKDIGETATAGSTSAGNIATVANPVIAKHKPAKKGKFGAPKAPQKKKADGTAVNALDMGNNLMGGGAVKR